MNVNKTTGSRPALTRRDAEMGRAETREANTARGYSADSGFDPEEMSPEDKASQKNIDEILNVLGNKADFKAYVTKKGGEYEFENELGRKNWEKGLKGLPSDALRRVQKKAAKEYEKLKAQGLSPSEIEAKLDKFMDSKLMVEEYNKSFFDQMMSRLAELNPWKE